MEKRKVYKISIIDREISRTEFDRNTFYTSDSELSLVFKLIERDYTYEHGEIILYNEDDKSFVTRQITKKDNDFVYELDSDIIPHYGKWKAQLQLVNDGDVYTSKPFEFSIVNDLSNLAPQPTLTDINNWSTLKQSANELIDEMQDLIVIIEQGELERVNKENLRQKAESERGSQENVRKQDEFKRESQESVRQQNELKRASQESVRQQAEGKRQSTFETNEKAEQERQSAESIRIDNEEQRKIDHENRSVELAGKANKIQEDWITPTLLGGATGTFAYLKDEFGFVHFKGRVNNAGNVLTMFVMPVDYRPDRNSDFIVFSSSNAKRVRVNSNGNVDNSDSQTFVELSSIIYKAEG